MVENKHLAFIKNDKLRELAEVIIYWIILSVIFSGSIFLYWGYRIHSKVTDDKQGVYFSSSNPEIKDSIIKPVGEVYSDKLRESIWMGILAAGAPALILQNTLSNKRRRAENGHN